MAKRKPTFVAFKSFEGIRQEDTFIRLTTSMLTSDIFKSLSPNSIKLYLFMKEFAQKRGQTEGFEYSWALAKKHNLFKSNNTYIKSKDELVNKGFIECIRTCKCSRQPNKYKFSNNWHK